MTVRLRRKDQLVQLSQPQAVNPAFMVDLDFTLMPEQVFTFETDRRTGGCGSLNFRIDNQFCGAGCACHG
jgi:hypothetical protein